MKPYVFSSLSKVSVSVRSLYAVHRVVSRVFPWVAR